MSVRQFVLAELRVCSQLFFYLGFLANSCSICCKMDTPQGGLLAFLLEEGSGVSKSTTFSANARREWNEETLRFLVGLCEEKYWKYNRKPFKKANWEYFAGKVNEKFLNEPQRTWHQTRDKWYKMRTTYQEKKTKQAQTVVPPSSWTPWYEIFDNILLALLKPIVYLMVLIKVCICNIVR